MENAHANGVVLICSLVRFMFADYMARERSAYISNTCKGGLGKGGARHEGSAALDGEYLPTCQTLLANPSNGAKQKASANMNCALLSRENWQKSVLARLQQQRRNVIGSKCRGLGRGEVGEGIEGGYTVMDTVIIPAKLAGSFTIALCLCFCFFSFFLPPVFFGFLQCFRG